MGYMLCIFSVIYFIYKIINYKGQRKNIIINFLILSIISGLMSAFVLIPSAFAILNGRTIGSINYFKINIYNLSSIIYNLFPGSFLKTDNFNDGTCVIGVSLFCLSLIILYFFNKKISKKEKISTLTVILFFILSFSFNLFDYAWNMFTKPVWWNCRYAFLFSLFLIIISHKSFINLKDINVNSKKISITTISIFLLSLVSFSLKVIGTHPKTITAIILFIGNIYIIIYLNLLIKLSKRHNYLNYILILILLLSEIIYNGYYLFHLDNSIKYNNTISTFNKKEKNIKFLKTKDNLFYRIYDYDDSHENNGLIYNYSSAQLFSSVYNKRVNEFYSKYIEVNKTNDSTTNHTEITYPNLELLSLIGTKYLISQNDDIFYKVKKDINRNNYALSPFILVDNNKNINLISYDRYTNINNIYSYLANTKVNLYNDVNPTITYDNLDYNKHNNLKLKNKKKKGILTLNFISNTKGIIVPKNYEYFDDFATIYINDNKIDKDDFLKVNKNDNVKIIYKFNKKTYLNNINLNTLSIKILDIDKFNKTLCNINMPVYTLQNDKQNILNFNLKVNKNNQKLFMTIPYDKGLIIKVDDKEVKYNKEFNTFISINLNKGLHNIKINYFSKGLKLGIIISFSTLILTIFVTICNKKIDKKSKYRYNSIVNYKK